MRLKMIIPMLMLASSAHAGDLALTLPIGCKHIGDTEGYNYNETNYGVGLEYKGFGVMYYNNSYRKSSITAYYNVETYTYMDYLSFGVRLGGVTGYEEFTGWKVTPAMQPYASFHYKDQSVQVGVIPTGIAADSKIKAVITLDYKLNF